MSKKQFGINKENGKVGTFSHGDFDIFDEPCNGFYKIISESKGFSTAYYFKKKEIQIPKSADISIKHILDLNEVMNKFSDIAVKINNCFNIPTKEGVLLHGIQGSGKTTTLLALSNLFASKFDSCMIILITGFGDLSAALGMINDSIKNDFPETRFVFVMDECEDMFDDYEDDIKAILDGVNTVPNSLFLAATNYIDKIPDSIKNRPSRFGYVRDVSRLQHEDVILSILQVLNNDLTDDLKLEDDMIRSFVPQLKGTTFDELKRYFTQQVYNVNTAVSVPLQELNV